ncbi:MAG: tRNA pseudouridine(38-40) synthase TruA [Alphaproteobacteria bacterium]|nr:tRNA pseudouridine(38-40) synthase TruA [Alphaproteobacteria bacterium]
MRYRLTLEYDGAPFVGWQRQDNGDSVQATVEEAILRLTGEAVSVVGAGRTDAGVHALGQVAHFDLEKAFAPAKLRDGLNHFLRPAPVTVVEAAEGHPQFHARFSAQARHYRYRIVCRRAPLALARGHAWHVAHALDEAAMHNAAQALTGQHDFTTFRAAECQANSPVRTLDRLVVARDGEDILIEASARSFLHHQVRSIVGSLKLVGEGRWDVSEPGRALAAKDRSRCGPVAPAEGLYLVRVDY